MRTLLRTLLAMPLFVLVVALALLLALRITVLAPDFIKTQLAQSNIYEAIYDEASAAILTGVVLSQMPPGLPAATLLEAAKPPVIDYFAGKADGMIDDTFVWLAAANAPFPSLDLTDVSDLLPRIAAELERQIRPPPELEPLLRLHFLYLIPAEPFTLSPVPPELAPARTIYRFIPVATFWLGAAVALNALIILALGSSFGSALRGLGASLLPAALVIGILGVALNVPLETWQRFLGFAPEMLIPGPPLALKLVPALERLASNVLAAVGIRLVLAAVLMFGAAALLVAVGTVLSAFGRR